MNFFAKYFDALTIEELYEILKVRTEIFTFEQRIDYLDMDDVDYDAYHFFLQDGRKVSAYLRAYFKDGDQSKIYIGRVLSRTHRIGLGGELLQKTIAYIKENFNCQKICLDSQIGAIGFYEKFGFKTISEEFLEAGIPHVQMEYVIG